jgi:hypothetical protein
MRHLPSSGSVSVPLPDAERRYALNDPLNCPSLPAQGEDCCSLVSRDARVAAAPTFRPGSL